MYIRFYLDKHHFDYNKDDFYINMKFVSGWIVNQKENEYNPAHYHSNCSISAVLYLKVPEFRPRGFVGKKNIDGYRSEEHTSELPSHSDLVCRLLLENT